MDALHADGMPDEAERADRISVPDGTEPDMACPRQSSSRATGTASNVFRNAMIAMSVTTSVACLAIVASHAWGAPRSPHGSQTTRDVVCNRLAIVDADGKERIVVDVDKGNDGRILVQAPDGKRAIQLSVHPDGYPSIQFGTNKGSASFVIGPHGQMMCTMGSNGGDARMDIIFRPDGAFGASIYDSAKKLRAKLGIPFKVAGTVAKLADPDGKVIWQVPSSSNRP